jgi:hypothetical protein
MGTRKRRLILCAGVGIIAAWYGILLGSYVLVPALKNAIRTRAIEALRNEFGSEVRFQTFEVSFLPRVHVTARGVLIGNNTACPLIQATMADAQSDLLPWHIRTLVLQDLSLHIPTAGGPSVPGPPRGPYVRVDQVVSEHTHVEILPACGEQAPLRFELAHLRVKNFDQSQTAEFSASLISAQPHAEIQATGRLGRWNAQEPSLTHLQGEYAMAHCDLATLPGLRGVLSSKGRFEGVLQRIELAGGADASEFSLNVSGHPEPLRVTFQATVNASDGSASIERLYGTLQRSSFRASGRVRNVQDDRTREISLELSMNRGRLEDVLPLVSSATLPVSGDLRVRGKFEILPGEQNILCRLRLDSDFAAASVRFSSLDLREQLRNISRKAAGHRKDAASGSSITSMQGHLRLSSGVVEFSRLLFDLESASARLSGAYQLPTERLDLHGQMWMAAKRSQTAGGPKAHFRKAADRLIRSKGRGLHVPIKITGTRSNPAFALDVGNKAANTGSRSRRVLFSH